MAERTIVVLILEPPAIEQEHAGRGYYAWLGLPTFGLARLS